MTSRPWMPLYIADYRADTAHLSAAEHGAYLLLIMHYWQTGGLPTEDSQLARIACMAPAEWRKARPTIAKFFTDEWRHKRIDEEIAHAIEVSGKRKSAAQQRHSKRPANADANAEQLETQSQPHSEAKASGVPPPDPKVELFQRAKSVLGPKAGGSLTAKLLKSLGNEDDPRVLAKARARIEDASTKADPAAWLGRILAGPTRALTSEGQPYPEGII